MDIVIHHNPDCSVSRNVLRITRDAGFKPAIVDYLAEGWTRGQLQALFAASGLTPRTALREVRSPAQDLGLLNPMVAEDALLDAMIEHPVLVNRPLVVCRRGVRLCRPADTVLDLLPRWPEGPYHLEDGTLLIDQNGIRQKRP
jgi:arsenate reductase